MGEPLPDREGGRREFTDERRGGRGRARRLGGDRDRQRAPVPRVRERRDELERTIRGLETTTEISRALGGVTDLDRVLELVVKRSRALIDARAAEIGARARRRRRCARGSRRAVRRRCRRRSTFRNRPLGVPAGVRRAVRRGGRAAAAGVRGQRRDRGGDRPERGRGGAAARRSRPPRPSARAGRASCTTRRCSSSPGCGCCCRARAAAATASAIDAALETALEQITTGIGDLRSLITDLRPAALDELGIEPALESLAARVATSRSTSTSTSPTRPPAEIESTIYRLVQEALTNVAKHAARTRVLVQVRDAATVARGARARRRRGLRPAPPLDAGSGWSGCASGSRWCAGRSTVETAPGGGTTLRAVDPARLRPLAATCRGSAPRGTTITGQWALRISRPLTPPTITRAAGRSRASR